MSFILKAHNIRYTNNGITENKTRPDFIFPNIASYHDEQFPVVGLSMLASKSTCKDRWRQVLSEATKIHKKHLFTLEPSISENQTNEMKSKCLALVVPQTIKESYTKKQQTQILNLPDFLKLVKVKQQKYVNL